MNVTVRCGAVGVLLMVSVACGSSGPTSPTEVSRPHALPSPTSPPATGFPPPSGPSRTFTFERELSYRVRNYTKESRFVLYENGAFVLQYVGLGAEYRGGYTDANGTIMFEWEGSNIGGPWGATGTVKGDSLTVQYNAMMWASDFEDAVYVLVR